MTRQESEYRRLLRGTLIITAVCIVAVLICYFWIDRPVAFFVYGHHIKKIQVFRCFTYPPPEVQNWSVLMLTLLVLRRAWGTCWRWRAALRVACGRVAVA